MATLCLSVHGCDTVSGGAVELSWKLRPASSSLEDKFVDCVPDSDRVQADDDQDGRRDVTQIRLNWRVTTRDGEVQESSRAWRCGLNRGVTGFDLDAGTAELWVTPECESGPADPSTFIAPAPIVRQVIRGNTVSLGAVELVVQVNGCRFAAGSANHGANACICDRDR